MKMKTILTAATISIASFVMGQENCFVTKKGDTVRMFKNNSGKELVYKWNSSTDGDILMVKSSADYFMGKERLTYFRDDKGKRKAINTSKIKEMWFDGKHFIRIPGTKQGATIGDNSTLQEVIFTSSDYIISMRSFSFGVNGITIHNIKTGKNEVKRHHVSRKYNRDKKFFDEELKPKFKDCDEFISQLEANLEVEYEPIQGVHDQRLLFKGISNWECN